jgi:hypothetical protein
MQATENKKEVFEKPEDELPKDTTLDVFFVALRWALEAKLLLKWDWKS